MTEMTTASEKSSSVPVQIIRDALSRKIVRKPAYSLRAFARDLGLSPTFVSLFLNGKREINLERAAQFARVLDLSDLDAEKLLKAVTVRLAGDEESRSYVERILKLNFN